MFAVVRNMLKLLARRDREEPAYDGLERTRFMQIEATKKLFSVDEYYRMAEAGILGRKERVELIDGEIIQMSPIGPRHFGCLNRAVDVFTAAFRGRVVVSAQHPLRLGRFTEPQPDIALLRFRPDFYDSKTPAAEDTLLVLELSDSSLRYDRDVKLPLYAAAGVPEVWIANLGESLLLVCREPSGSAYNHRFEARRGDSVSVAAFPETVFKVEDFLG